MNENEVIQNVCEKFGSDLGARIYACAIIMKSTTEKLTDADMSTAVRFTIGALKRRRLQGGYVVMSWADAVEKLESEQDEGRHYDPVATMSKVARDIKRIEAINNDKAPEDIKADKAAAQVKAASMLAMALQAQHDRYNADVTDDIAVRAWIAEYMANITKTRLAFIRHVLADVQAGKGISRNDAQNIRLRYVPKGVQADDFIELIARYA